MRGGTTLLVIGACRTCMLTPDENPAVPNLLRLSLASVGAIPPIPTRHGTAITSIQRERSLMIHSLGTPRLETALPQGDGNVRADYTATEAALSIAS
jgi:hypothetical protein